MRLANVTGVKLSMGVEDSAYLQFIHGIGMYARGNSGDNDQIFTSSTVCDT